MNTRFKSACLLMITAIIWGFAFVAQRLGSAVGTFYYTGIRLGLGALTLIPVLYFLEHKDIDQKKAKATIKPSILTGLVLICASTTQQAGIALTDSTGKAGFISGFYIVLVPILGIFMHKKVKWNIWLGAILALIGILLLSITDFSNIFAIQIGDLLLFLSAFLYAIHILIIEHYSESIYPLRFSLGQYMTASIISLILGLLFEDFNFMIFKSSIIPLLYGGCISVGIGYTLQTIGQKGLDSSSSAIILSLESVFCVIGSALLLHETMSLQGMIGCSIAFIGLMLSQVNIKKKQTQ